MKTTSCSALLKRIEALAIFRNLLSDPAISELRSLLHALSRAEAYANLCPGDASLGAGLETESEDDEKGSPEAGDVRPLTPGVVSGYIPAIEHYANFVSALYRNGFAARTGSDLSAYISLLVTEDENFYIKEIAAGRSVENVVRDALREELETLELLARLTSEDIKKRMSDAFGEHDLSFLPDWDNAGENISSIFAKRMENINTMGYGIYAKYHAFTVADEKLIPVKNPDSIRIEQLYGYERERRQIIQNTEALLAGEACNNILLYGDAGTGKSSTVKAVANEYADRGLRLIEVKKKQLYQIPSVVEEISEVPLKFLLFIDDLSFSKNDDNFSALKAILEGSIAGGSGNTIVYATSNRRHLVKESMRDRDCDELFTNDTLQEISSLSARFGLTVTFQKPNKDNYLAIVESLAAEYDLAVPKDVLLQKAEAFAIRANGRTPRAAKQFVKLMLLDQR